MTFALFGHSFIARISNHPVLEMADSSVHFFGLSGGTSRQILFHNTTQRMIQTKPSKIYVQIGENDISFQSDPFQIVKDIARLVNTFRDIPTLNAWPWDDFLRDTDPGGCLRRGTKFNGQLSTCAYRNTSRMTNSLRSGVWMDSRNATRRSSLTGFIYTSDYTIATQKK